MEEMEEKFIGKYIDNLALSTFATGLSYSDIFEIIRLEYSDRVLNVFILNVMSGDEILVGYFGLNGKFHILTE
jgi:hypothetical protein